MRAFTAVLLGALLAVGGAQKNPNWTQGRNTIVHLFEWKWSDIALECERFLAPYGYAGVQTSPANENAAKKDRPWWERYQPLSYRLATRSGDETAFADMVRRCNDVGVRVYVDVVLNHMASDYSNPGLKPVFPDYPYGPNDFNPTCWFTNINNVEEMRNCQVGGPDINQGSSNVRETIIRFLNIFIDYGVAGFRVDAAKYMWPTDLEYIYANVENLNTDYGFAEGARPFFFQEVIDMTGTDVGHNYEYTGIGRVTEFRYGLELSVAFGGYNALKWLSNFGPIWRLMEGDDALAFIDNHDNQRGHGGAGDILTFKRPKQYKMAVAFMQAWPYAVTRVMSSYYFDNTDAGPPADENENILDVVVNSDLSCSNDWVCEHRWQQIYNMVQFRKTVESTEVLNWWDNANNQIAFSRGNEGFIAFNDENVDLAQILQTGLPEGTYCDLISGLKSSGRCTGKNVVVESDGTAFIEINTSDEDGVLAITVDSRLD